MGAVAISEFILRIRATPYSLRNANAALKTEMGHRPSFWYTHRETDNLALGKSYRSLRT